MTITNMTHISFYLPEDEKLLKRFLDAHNPPQDGWFKILNGDRIVTVCKTNIRKETYEKKLANKDLFRIRKERNT